jgi:putative transposase
MDTERFTSAMRLELRPGAWVLWDLRPHRFESLQGERARIRDATSNEVHEVEVASLRALPSLAASDLDARLATQHDIDPALWSIAQSREEIVRDINSGDRTTEAKVQCAAKTLGLSTRSVYRLLARYRAAAQTTSLAPQRRGPHKKRRRLGMIRERLIDEAIEHRYLVRPRTPMEEVYRNVVQRCGQLYLPAPARNSIIKRIRALDARHVARRRLGSKAAQSITLSTPGTLEAKDALDLIQIDHTLADVIVVDSRYRKPIGRPWLSVAIDVATRCVLGVHIALEAPSALAVALCLEHACLPKNRATALSASDAPWPMFGLPRCILVDNGAEFHGAALVRGCSEYGITLSHRPVARPHFGGHIERLIGTLMGHVHLLPGTTDASPAARGGYDSEGEARLTLDEFCEWLALEIAGRYHHSIHHILGTTPAAAWADSLAGGVHPTLPADPGRFLLSFLPMVRRRLQRNGLHFERIRYWSDLLPAIAQPREPLIVRYDPRDLSCLYALGPDRHYHSIPYADLTHPPISLCEVRHLHAMLRTQAKGRIDENQLFAMHERQRELVHSAIQSTKASRRRDEKRRRAPPSLPASDSIDYSKDPAWLPSEIWEDPL